MFEDKYSSEIKCLVVRSSGNYRSALEQGIRGLQAAMYWRLKQGCTRSLACSRTGGWNKGKRGLRVVVVLEAGTRVSGVFRVRLYWRLEHRYFDVWLGFTSSSRFFQDWFLIK